MGEKCSDKFRLEFDFHAILEIFHYRHMRVKSNEVKNRSDVYLKRLEKYIQIVLRSGVDETFAFLKCYRGQTQTA